MATSINIVKNAKAANRHHTCNGHIWFWRSYQLKYSIMQMDSL